MLIGQYKHTIDTKKRLALPAKFRGELGNKVVVTTGTNNCLVVYTEKEWKAQADKLGQLPVSQSEARTYSRIMLANATEANLDKLGRILLPDYLKDYAGLKKDVMICGLSNKLEVWDAERWQEYKQKAEKEFDSITSKLGELGI